MTPRPTNDSILLRVLESDAQIATIEDYLGNGVTFVASTSDRIYKRAEVVAIGPGRRITQGPRKGFRAPMSVAVGDLVIYRDWLVRWHNGLSIWPGPGDLALVQETTRTPEGKRLSGEDEHAIVAVVEKPESRIDFPRSFGSAPEDPVGFFNANEARGTA